MLAFQLQFLKAGPGKRVHIVAHTLLPKKMFPRLPARATFVADTKHVSDFVQKHFVSATNVSHHGQQCVRNNVSTFSRAFKHGRLMTRLGVFLLDGRLLHLCIIQPAAILEIFGNHLYSG